ncbi:abscisic acid 8'-hydroxylase CYP707A2-like isoform X1 [Abrus precatorius]|uniref:Abscisic acid 8'-hydroxylase CYP707A2-like isoform X1 n=1 Tax=Abrus precatorius TaxID=3816 RepID=A0A8B8LWH3_ABRPR|nr:abscisic acid 8'-hydroxylase CYP707A2-like isoform X1 [Abrus precatorius]
MELSTMLCLFASFLFIVLFKKLIKPYVSKRRDLPLPPGSMGWPYIGETFQMYSQDPNVFFATKIKRYGSMFKSHILGCPCVMISSPEAAKFVLNKAQLFKPTFPASKERMLGKQAIFFHQGEYHANLRRLVLRTFMPEAIKNIVPNIETIAQDCLKSWEGRLITTFLEMKTFTFNVALLSIFGKEEILYREALKRCYYTLEQGYNSMPINLPGTLFHKAMKARKELAQILAQIIASRRQRKQDYKDLLGSFMGEKAGLTDEQIADNVIGVIFAARDTTASVLTWIVKYLGENPSVLEAVTVSVWVLPFIFVKQFFQFKGPLDLIKLFFFFFNFGISQEEQECILKSKEENGEDKGLNWEDAKKMPITSRVIQETLRVASILSFTFREAVEDVEYQGYLIPKGWKVLPLFRNIHHSPDNFKEPEKFDPSRFEAAPKPNTFMPFGSGIHACPGNELAKLEILVLLHHLTTKYRWSVVGAKNGIQYGPFALPQNGLPITLYPKK